MLLAATIAVAVAWSLGLAGPGAPDASRGEDAAMESPTARSPYPSDIAGLASHPSLPEPPPLPAASADLGPIAAPVRVAPTESDTAVAAAPAFPMLARVSRARVEAAPPISMAVKTGPPPPKSRSRPDPGPRPSVPRFVPAREAEPLAGSLTQLFGPGDYPAAARLNREQGDVTVRMTVDARGRVSACRILAADASASLKAATCAVLIERARFVPAAATGGVAAQGSYVQHVAWRLP